MEQLSSRAFALRKTSATNKNNLERAICLQSGSQTAPGGVLPHNHAAQ